jgi:hypothetical protein
VSVPTPLPLTLCGLSVIVPFAHFTLMLTVVMGLPSLKTLVTERLAVFSVFVIVQEALPFAASGTPLQLSLSV